METIKITSEEEAFELLSKLIEGFQLEESFEVEFESWPRFVIRIKGGDFDGTIPTRIMPTLLELQKEVHRVYCKTNYGEESTRRLTKQDREELELLVRVDKGSSIFETFLNEPIARILQGAITKMTPEQITAILIVFGLSVTSVVFWKIWINYRTKEKELDHTLELSKIEKEKMDLIRKAAMKFPETQAVSEGMDNVRNELLTKMKPSDSLEVDTGTEQEPYPTLVQINGEQASQLTHKPREKAVERLIDGEFFLRSTDFTRAEGVRAEVQRLPDGYSFRADIPLGVLKHDQIEALKNNSWNRKSVLMSVLVKELYGTYTSAKVVSVKEKEESEE
ncbi:MAG: hypothetical protein M0Z78_05685 [Betaproteobacteria bacterium]|nr:hypothetical protein [Betaproteobacteria bacterium]